MENGRLIAVYARVSTSNQENEGTIETQLSAVYEFAREKGYIIVEKYVDEGWSGDNLVRPGLDKLRMDAKSKNWETVLIYDPDRLARRGAWQEVVIEELKEIDIEVLFVTVPQAKTDEDKIMQKMRGVFTEYERMKINERFRLGKLRKAREGNIIATEAPYGYTFIPKRGKRGDVDFLEAHYEINEYEAEIVKKLFLWVADEALTLRGTVRRLQELGIQPRKSKRGVWSTSTLSTLLRNKTYIGEGRYGGSYAVVPTNPLKKGGYKKVKKTSRRTKPESEWIKIPTPRLIDDELFFRAGERLRSNFEKSARNTKNEYLLAGRIWCMCGVKRGGEGPQCGKHLYYRCTDRVKSFPLPATCEEASVNARTADSMVWEKVVELMSSPELITQQAERWLSSRNTPSTSTINVRETEKEIAKLKDQEERYAKAYGVGAISLDQLKEYTDPVKEKISIYKNQIAQAQIEITQREDKGLPELSEIDSFAQKASNALQDLSFLARKAIIGSVIEKVVGTKNELQVYGYIPITTNINVFPSYRNCRSSQRW